MKRTIKFRAARKDGSQVVYSRLFDTPLEAKTELEAANNAVPGLEHWVEKLFSNGDPASLQWVKDGKFQDWCKANLVTGTFIDALKCQILADCNYTGEMSKFDFDAPDTDVYLTCLHLVLDKVVSITKSRSNGAK